jgi:hypothetical protein
VAERLAGRLAERVSGPAGCGPSRAVRSASGQYGPPRGMVRSGPVAGLGWAAYGVPTGFGALAPNNPAPSGRLGLYPTQCDRNRGSRWWQRVVPPSQDTFPGHTGRRKRLLASAEQWRRSAQAVWGLGGVWSAPGAVRDVGCGLTYAALRGRCRTLPTLGVAKTGRRCERYGLARVFWTLAYIRCRHVSKESIECPCHRL